MAANSTLALTYRTKKTGTGTQDATKELEKFNGTIGGLKGALGMLAGGTALGAVTAGLKFAITEAMEAERVMALTESTIKATGGAAGLTAQQVADMASNLSQMTGIADDTIQSGQNMLLTFKEIKGDNFERATKAMNDMAVAMNGGSVEGLDLKSTAIQLGKALNDPIKGVTALTKVGVSFTDAQKAAIKQMVEMNDTAGAQAIILAELESEFGGAAEAAGKTLEGSLAKLKNTASELAETLGKELLPPLTEAANAAVILLQWSDKVNLAYDEQIERVRTTASSYEEYVDGVLAAAVAAQKLDQSWVNLHRQEVLQGAVLPGVTASLKLLNRQLFETQFESSEAARAAGRNASAQYEAAKIAEANADRYQGLADKLGVTTAANFELARAAGDAATTQQANADAAAKAAEAQAAAQKSLDNRVTAYYDLATALKDATALELAQTQINQIKALRDAGVISIEEEKAAIEGLGLAYGIFTPQSLALATATDELTRLFAAHRITEEDLVTATRNLSAAAADGKVDLDELGITVKDRVTPQFANARDKAELFEGKLDDFDGRVVTVTADKQSLIDAAEAAQGYTDKLDGIDGRVVTNTIVTNHNDYYNSNGAPTFGTDGYEHGGPGGANGLDFVVPPGYPNDSFPFRAQSGERVMVIPEGEPGNSGPGGDTYQITINAPGATASQLYDMLNKDDIRRRTGARRR